MFVLLTCVACRVNTRQQQQQQQLYITPWLKKKMNLQWYINGKIKKTLKHSNHFTQYNASTSLGFMSIWQHHCAVCWLPSNTPSLWARTIPGMGYEEPGTTSAVWILVNLLSSPWLFAFNGERLIDWFNTSKGSEITLCQLIFTWLSIPFKCTLTY